MARKKVEKEREKEKKGEDRVEERARRWVENLVHRTHERECEHPPAKRGISSWLSHAFSAN